MLTKYFIYRFKKTNELHYYKRSLKSVDPKYDYVGTCEIDESTYFGCIHLPETKSSMYTRKEIASRANMAIKDNDPDLCGMLNWLLQLRYSFIPQMLKHFEPDSGGLYTPHKMKIKQS